MQFPIISGIYTDGGPDVRRALPRNLVPVGQTSGVSEGYLRPADGLVGVGITPGIDRGGIVFEGFHIRVLGTSVCVVAADGSLTPIGDIGGSGRCLFAYDTSTLAICTDERVFFLSRVNGVWDLRQLDLSFPPPPPAPPPFFAPAPPPSPVPAPPPLGPGEEIP
jgi:hypothetical protein